MCNLITMPQNGKTLAEKMNVNLTHFISHNKTQTNNSLLHKHKYTHRYKLHKVKNSIHI